MDLSFVNIGITVECCDALSLKTRLYSAGRIFERKFRELCCMTPDKLCRTCREFETCPFVLLFSQRLSEDVEIVRRHQKPPLPFAFRFQGTAQDRNILRIELAIAGSAMNHAENLIEAFSCQVLDLDDSALVSSVDCIDSYGARSVFKHDGLIVLSADEMIRSGTAGAGVGVILLSPLRMVRNGATLKEFVPGLFLCSVMRRLSALSAYYGDGELPYDFKSLSVAARQVLVTGNSLTYGSPDSSTSESRISGLFGETILTGISDELAGMLLLGSYFNTGKGATYGYGAYRTRTDS